MSLTSWSGRCAHRLPWCIFARWPALRLPVNASLWDSIRDKTHSKDKEQALAHPSEPARVTRITGHARLPDLSTLTFTRIVQPGDTLASLAPRFWSPSGNALALLATLNADAVGLLVPQTVALVFTTAKMPMAIVAGDTLRSVLERVQKKKAAITLEELALALQHQQGLLQENAPMVCPPARLPQQLRPEAITALYQVSPLAFVLSNAAVSGLLEPGLTLASGQADVPAVVTEPGDSFNSVLARFASSSLRVADIVEANAGLAMLAAGAVALLPPAGEKPEQSTGAPTAAAGTQAQPETNTWTVDCGSAGGARVSLREGVRFQGAEQPRELALKPHYPSLVSRLVSLRPLQDDGQLATTTREYQFRAIDVERWVQSFLTDMDRLAPLLVLADDEALLPARRRLDQARTRLIDAIGQRLGPVWRVAPDAGTAGAVQDPQLELGLRSARHTLGQGLATGMAAAYATSAIVQFETAVEQPWTGRCATTAVSLEGQVAGVERVVPTPAPHWQTALPRLPLQQAAAFLDVGVRATDVEAQTGIPVDRAYDVTALDFDVATLPGQTGYRVAASLGLQTRPGQERYTVPVIARGLPDAHSLHQLALGITEDSDERPTLGSLAQWAYTITCRGTPAAQDVLHLAIALNRALPFSGSPAALAADSADFFAALAQYQAVAPQLWQLLPQLGKAGALPAPVRNALASQAALVELVAEQWNQVGQAGVAPQPPQDQGDLQFSLSARYRFGSAGRRELDEVFLVQRRGDARLPGWPQLYCRLPDGEAVALLRGAESAAGLTFRVPEAVQVPASDLTLTLAWEALALGTIQEASCGLSVWRNVGLGAGRPALDQSFLAWGEPVALQAVAAPCNRWRGAVALTGASLEAAVIQALREIFPPAQRHPDLRLSVSLGYSYEIVPGEPEPVELPVAVLPDSEIDDAIVKALAENAAAWLKAVEPRLVGATWLLDIGVYSTQGGGRRPLLQGRLSYRL